MRLGIKEIAQILPHRHPFLLVDYIEEMEPGVSAVGYKCVTFHEDFFRGHFPQETVIPEYAVAAASFAAKQGSTPAIVTSASIVTSTVTSATIVSASGIAAASAVITVCSS